MRPILNVNRSSSYFVPLLETVAVTFSDILRVSPHYYIDRNLFIVIP